VTLVRDRSRHIGAGHLVLVGDMTNRETRGEPVESATQRLARASARRPWLVVGLWIATITVAGFLSSQFLGGALTTEIDFTNDPEAKRAAGLIEQRFGDIGETEVFILSSTGATVNDRSFERAVSSLQESASNQGAEATTFYDSRDHSMVSDDGHTTLMPVTFEKTDEVADLLPAVEALRDEANQSGGSDCAFVGRRNPRGRLQPHCRRGPTTG
jgi:hypothetical protein